MAFVASSAAAADTPAQAPAAGTRRRPMLQAERALCAAARTWGVAALRRRERDAAGRSPRGLPGIWKQGGPPLEGAGEIIHEKAVTVLWPHARRRPQAPGPRVAAVRRPAKQLQHDLVARREVWSCREPRAHAPPRGRSERQRPSGAPPSSAPAARWRSAGPTALCRTWARSPSGRRVPRSRWSGEAGSARPTKAS